MKLKIIIILSLITASVFYVYQDKALQKQILNKVHTVVPELNKSTLYKWKNARGEWQITDRPPASGIPFTSISSKDQINVLQNPSKEKK